MKAKIRKDYEVNTDRYISYNERMVISSFLEQYRDKDTIVADKYMTDTEIVTLKGEQVAFTSNEEYRKIVDFQRKIVYDRKPYLVKLGLLSLDQPTDDPKCLMIHHLDIITSNQEHSITLDTSDYFQKNVLYSIVDIFDDKKVVSPEAAYFKKMYTNTPLQGFINNHEWGKIIEGVNQKPSLSNALFIMGKLEKNYNSVDVNFGTILYQLIDYRNNHENEFTKSDLLELDKVILELSKTELLKVRLYDAINYVGTAPTECILLDMDNYSYQVHKSEQFNVDNGKLLDEKKSLNKVLKQFK